MTTETNIETLKYPIGKLNLKETYSREEIEQNIAKIEKLPEQLKETMALITEEDFQKTYRPGAWNIQQLVHHIADSHVNVYTRAKLMISNDHPTITPYPENAWVEMEDGKSLDVNYSMMILEGIHKRLSVFLWSLEASQFDRTFFHPEYKRSYSLADICAMYAWHGAHHLAHIRIAANLD